MPVTYCDEAYNEVMTWTADTKIQYAPNRKSGKSFHRYGAYMKAKTVGEALKLGSLGLDLLFDFEKKLLWSTGGPKRDRPPELSKLPKEELKALNQTDRLLGKMYSKWKMWTTTFKVMEEHGYSRKELKEMNDEQDEELGKDNIIVMVGRRRAQERARMILDKIEAEGGRRVKDEEVLSCLNLWGFKENTNRGNVMPDGAEFVYSDTIGLIKMSTCERTLLTIGSKRYPEFTQLLTRWLKERMPAGLDFAYTSININKNYAGKLHRDGNNVGPSLIRALGDFKGGELNYYPSDDKKTPLEMLDEKDKVTVDIKNKLLLFDGNRGHYVSNFKGERFTLVFFSIRTWNKVPKEDIEEAIKCGIPVPTKETMAAAQGLLGPKGEEGYVLWSDSGERLAGRGIGAASKAKKTSANCWSTPVAEGKKATKKSSGESSASTPAATKKSSGESSASTPAAASKTRGAKRKADAGGAAGGALMKSLRRGGS